MNKQHELAALKEQREQLNKQIERVQLELKNETSKWDDGYWWIHCSSYTIRNRSTPHQEEIKMGVVFTTEANCQAYIDYQKAMVRLRDACRPYRTDDPENAYFPCINHVEKADFHCQLNDGSKMFWVSSAEKATQIASEHIEDLKIIRDFKWEE
jgi:hypothetical protein